jgi:hypothetical protein
MIMNIQELSARLTGIIEQRKLKAKLESDLGAVEKDLQEKSTLLKSLRTRLEKEKIDVEKLERTSLTSLFHSVLGNREQQMEKERQELLTTQLLFHQKEYQVSYLQQEQAALVEKIACLSGIEAEYQHLLSEKEEALRRSNRTVAGELMELSEAQAQVNSEIKELDEAIGAGNNAVPALEKLIGSLESAEGWGLWDLFGGGLLSTAVKHSRIDDARSEINEVQARMSRFKRELADVQKSLRLEIDISRLDTFADFFFDNLIVDWVVQSKIVRSLEQARETKTLIENAVVKIEARKRAAESEFKALQEKHLRLVENS